MPKFGLISCLPSTPGNFLECFKGPQLGPYGWGKSYRIMKYILIVK
jgi:hypothetical protein